ncbi:VIT1/CCC1 transporter family protein [Eubacteriales bacterium OttesenSCG-928-M02]|nr:VIT1/CCC1 transporter family protein [Eubacteriales bacterium OttesenSCG-928-M02]
MAKRQISKKNMEIIRAMQQNEITEYHIYMAIAERAKGEENKKVLRQIGEEERRHYEIWKGYTGEEIKPKRWKMWWIPFLARILGFTFAVKYMENGEEDAQQVYETLAEEIPESLRIREEENAHENALLEMLDEERLQYVGSMVLGLNDALVELTGTLAGLSFALQDTKLIALSGLITGISATLSMASSEYLSARSEGRTDALKSCTYTGIAYLITVALLILPYLLLPSHAYAWALGIMVATVVLIIFVFNYYLAVAKSLDFKKRFLEMAAISLGVAALSFVVGLVVKEALGIDV